MNKREKNRDQNKLLKVICEQMFSYIPILCSGTIRLSPSVVFTVILELAIIDKEPRVGHRVRIEILRHRAGIHWHLANVEVIYRPRGFHVT